MLHIAKAKIYTVYIKKQAKPIKYFSLKIYPEKLAYRIYGIYLYIVVNQTHTIMKNNIETLEQAIEAGVAIKATYTNGERVKVLEFTAGGRVEIEYQDGTFDCVDRNDLIDFTWVDTRKTEFALYISGPNGKTVNRYGSFKTAYQLYMEHCNDKNLDNMTQPVDQNTAMDLYAGGRGYDYTIELIEELA